MELSRQWRRRRKRRRFQKSSVTHSALLRCHSFFLPFRRFASKLSRGEAGALFDLRYTAAEGGPDLGRRFREHPPRFPLLKRLSNFGLNSPFSRRKIKALPHPFARTHGAEGDDDLSNWRIPRGFEVGGEREVAATTPDDARTHPDGMGRLC